MSYCKMKCGHWETCPKKLTEHEKTCSGQYKPLYLTKDTLANLQSTIKNRGYRLDCQTDDICHPDGSIEFNQIWSNINGSLINIEVIDHRLKGRICHAFEFKRRSGANTSE